MKSNVKQKRRKKKILRDLSTIMVKEKELFKLVMSTNRIDDNSGAFSPGVTALQLRLQPVPEKKISTLLLVVVMIGVRK